MTKKFAIAKLQQEADALLQTAKLINALIPDDMPGEIWGTSNNIRIDIPFDIPMFKEVRQKIGKNWKLTWIHFDQKKGDKYFHYRSKIESIRLTITLDPEKSHSTCQRVQVGTKEIPVYEVICQ